MKIFKYIFIISILTSCQVGNYFSVSLLEATNEPINCDTIAYCNNYIGIGNMPRSSFNHLEKGRNTKSSFLLAIEDGYVLKPDLELLKDTLVINILIKQERSFFSHHLASEIKFYRIDFNYSSKGEKYCFASISKE